MTTMPTSARFNCAIACSALLFAGCAREARSAPRGVILICIDTLRADHLGAYGYPLPTSPALDRLAAEGLCFEDASAVSGWTKPSVPAFLTGTYPCENGVYEGSASLVEGAVTDVLPQSATTLAEVFSGAGWRTAAFLRNAQLRPGNGFEQGFESYVDEVGDARAIRERAQGWLGGLKAGEPFFLYLHFLDAHWPYPVPEEYATRFAEAAQIAPFSGDAGRALVDAVNDGERELTPAERAALIGLYDGAIRYVDDQLGELFAFLDAQGLADEVAIAVVADHGEEFGEHGRIGHGHGLSQGLLHVPWILRAPGVAPARSSTPVSLIDLFATLVSAAGLEPWPTSGIDRLANPHGERPILAEHKAPDRYLHALRSGDEKLLRKLTPPDRAAAPGALPLRLGERVEVELVHTGGRLVATEFKPHDDDPEDPLELKAPLAKLQGERFELAGIPVLLEPEAERQEAEGAGGTELREGAYVKVRGVLEDGVLVADRIKFYGPEEEPIAELRGPVSSLAGTTADGKVVVGAIELAVDRETEFDDLEAPKTRLERDEIVRALAEGFAALEPEGYAIARESFEVRAAEERPAASPSTRLEGDLERLFRELSAKRTFSAADRLLLDDETVERLKDLGYVR